jgi:hypothetical protein
MAVGHFATEYLIPQGALAVGHRDVPMSPVPRLPVWMDCQLREFDWRSHWEMNAGFSR